ASDSMLVKDIVMFVEYSCAAGDLATFIGRAPPIASSVAASHRVPLTIYGTLRLPAVDAYRIVTDFVDSCWFTLHNASPKCMVKGLGGVMAQLRIGDQTHKVLRELARLEGVSMQGVLDKALAEYQKKRFFDSLGAAFDALKNDRKAWTEEQQERQAWDNTLSDDIEPGEVWTEDGNVIGGS
ncbi:MAG TPA: hypothetical protein VJP89_02580, partial [Pyrinomonadaceae bacterium]|nr:hypothetical protein [Pyrinomonadaceae bacterium]